MSSTTARAAGAAAVGGVAVLVALAATLLAEGQDPRPGLDVATRYGASFQTDRGESYLAALDRTDRSLGRLDVVRVYYPGPPDPWPGKAPGRDVVVSFKLGPREVTAGQHDAAMREWFATTPPALHVNWVYWHEPEDDAEAGSFSATDYRAAFAHLDALADEVGNPRLRSTVILQSWSTRAASGREWRDFLPDPTHVDVLAWDVYNRRARLGEYTDPAQLLDAPRRASESVDRPFAVAEMGSAVTDGDDGSGRATWLRAMGDYLDRHDADFAAYFDFRWNDGADDYRLRDQPSLGAWRDISTDDGRGP